MNQADPAPLAALLRPVITRLTLLLRREATHLPLSVPQGTVLASLAECGPTRVSDLAAAVQVTQPSMTALVNRMQAQGWVSRGADPDDQRAVRVELTPRGRAVVGEAAQARDTVLAARLARLTADDRHAIEAALPALTRLVSSEEPS